MEDRASYYGVSRLTVLHESTLGLVATMGTMDFPFSPAGKLVLQGRVANWKEMDTSHNKSHRLSTTTSRRLAAAA